MELPQQGFAILCLQGTHPVVPGYPSKVHTTESTVDPGSCKHRLQRSVRLGNDDCVGDGETKVVRKALEGPTSEQC